MRMTIGRKVLLGYLGVVGVAALGTLGTLWALSRVVDITERVGATVKDRAAALSTAQRALAELHKTVDQLVLNQDRSGATFADTLALRTAWKADQKALPSKASARGSRHAAPRPSSSEAGTSAVDEALREITGEVRGILVSLQRGSSDAAKGALEQGSGATRWMDRLSTAAAKAHVSIPHTERALSELTDRVSLAVYRADQLRRLRVARADLSQATSDLRAPLDAAHPNPGSDPVQKAVPLYTAAVQNIAERFARAGSRPPSDAVHAEVESYQLLADALENAALSLNSQVTSGLRQANQTALVASRGAMIGGALILAVALIASLVITRRVAGPLVRLQRATRTVGSGRMDVIVAPTSDDEVGDLTVAFNRMAAQLGELEQLKQDFVHGITHDLKSPIATVKQGLQLLEDGIPGPLTDSQREVLRLMSEGNAQLSALVSDLLDSAKLESGTFKLDLAPMPVARFLQQQLNLLVPQAQARQLTLSGQLIGDDCVILADAHQLARVLHNLCTNAFKFTPAGGRVTVEADSTADDVILRVSDTGSGIAPEHLTRVFQRYQQIGRASGVGLGLTITRQLVEAHGGTISLQSALGHGTTFTIRLPRGTSTTSSASRAS